MWTRDVLHGFQRVGQRREILPVCAKEKFFIFCKAVVNHLVDDKIAWGVLFMDLRDF